MNWTVFTTVYVIAVVLVLVQAFTSWLDGFLYPLQLRDRGVEGWSFVQHGGMWADIVIIAPLLAYITGKYHLDLTSLYSIGILVADRTDTVLLLRCSEVRRTLVGSAGRRAMAGRDRGRRHLGSYIMALITRLNASWRRSFFERRHFLFTYRAIRPPEYLA